MTAGYTLRLATVASGPRFQDCPAAAVRAARDDLLDIVGVAIAGARDPAIRKFVFLA